MFSTAYLDQFGLCRLCLIREKVNIPIFEEQQSHFSHINIKINTCLPIKVDQNDKLPKKICVDCYYKLESFYQFYNVSADAEKQLLSWVEETSSPVDQEDAGKSLLTKELQQKVDNFKTTSEVSENDTKEGPRVKEEDELDNRVGEQKDDSDDCNVWKHDNFTSCQVGISEESDDWTPKAEKKTLVKKKLISKIDTRKEKIESKRPAKNKIKVSRGKRLTRSTFYYKKLSDKEFECLECYQKFKSLYQVKIHHRQMHLQKYTFKCNICDNTFTTAPAFKSHQKMEHGIVKDDIFSCNECDFTSSTKHNLAVHKLRKHSTTECPFECDICKKKFKTRDDIRLHMPNHGEYEHMCDICGQFFISQHALTRHRRVRHINTYDYQCSICKIKLISQVNLDNHMRENHNPNDQIKCQECGQEFGRKRYLIRHQKRVHQKLEKAHLCTVCGKSFVCMNTFRIHYLTHTKLKPYVCNVCGGAFSQRSSMMLHWKKQHPDAQEPPPKVTLTNFFDSFSLTPGDNSNDGLGVTLSNSALNIQ